MINDQYGYIGIKFLPILLNSFFSKVKEMIKLETDHILRLDLIMHIGSFMNGARIRFHDLLLLYLKIS